VVCSLICLSRMRLRDLGFGSLSLWPPQRCYRTLRLSIYGITTILGGSNMYLAICERTRKAMMVDFSDPNPARWSRIVQQHHVDVTKIVQTHGECSETVELSRLKDLSFFSSQLKVYGHPKEPVLARQIDVALHDGLFFELGDLRFKCLHIPGPSPGHCAFFEAAEGIAFTGNIISRGGQMTRAVSDPLALKASLTKLVKEIPETTLLFPGHYGLTTMGAERRMNPELMGVTGPPLVVPREVSELADMEKKRKIKRWSM
jgi:hypothetical protein